jgi:hypothetical protein
MATATETPTAADFARNASRLFLGPMCWVGGGKSAINANLTGTVQITRYGAYVNWHHGCTLIGGF